MKICQTDTCGDCATFPDSILSRCLSSELQAIESSKEIRNFGFSEKIYSENEMAEGIFCLQKGLVRLARRNRYGIDQTLRVLKPGEMFGFGGILSPNEEYTVSAIALDMTTVCFIPKQTCISLMKNNPQFSLHLMQYLCRQIDLVEKLMTA